MNWPRSRPSFISTTSRCGHTRGRRLFGCFRGLPAGNYRLLAVGEGRPVTDLGSVRLGDDTETVVERTVTPAGALSLLVPDGRGRPLVEVEIDLRADTDPPFERVLVTGLGKLSWWPSSRLRGRSIHAERTLRTNADGRLRLGLLSPGRYVATAGDARVSIEIRSGEETEAVLVAE